MSSVLRNETIGKNDQLVRAYRKNLRELGFCSEMLFYGSEAPHHAKMAEVGAVISRKASAADYQVLDVGCGYGSLIDFLPPHKRYVGVDLVPEFVAEARRRYPNRKFIRGNVGDVEGAPFDVVVLAVVLGSVPDPVQVLTDALKMSCGLVVFDVTMHDRVRKGFEGLNLWSAPEAKRMAEDLGISNVKMHDGGQVWVILSGMLE